MASKMVVCVVSGFHCLNNIRRQGKQFFAVLPKSLSIIVMTKITIKAMTKLREFFFYSFVFSFISFVQVEICSLWSLLCKEMPFIFFTVLSMFKTKHPLARRSFLLLAMSCSRASRHTLSCGHLDSGGNCTSRSEQK